MALRGASASTFPSSGTVNHAPLVPDFEALGHDAEPRPFVIALGGDGDSAADGVADKDRLWEAEAFVAVSHGEGVDLPSGHPDRDTEDQCAVRYPVAKGLRL